MDWKITGFVHSGITVESLERALDFYTKTLGLEVIKLQTNDAPYVRDIVKVPKLEKIELAFLKAPDGSVIELLEYIGPDRYPGASRSCDYGSGHICLAVSNIESMYDDLISKGVEFISDGPVLITEGKHKGAYMKDPDGYIIELMEK